MSNSFDPLDATVRIVTPENIAFHYRLAGPFRRLPAFVIDVILQGIIVLCCGMLLAFIGAPAGLGVFLVILFVVFWGYGGLFETYLNGQTPGKAVMGIRVVSTGGLPISAQQAMLRNILRVIDFTFYLSAAGLSFLLTRRFQRLGDLAADTMAVVDEGHELTRIERLHFPEAEKLAESIPRSFEADGSLAEALASYVARRWALVPARRMEVASHLAIPLARQFGLPPETDPDVLLCALYGRVFWQ